MNKLSILALTFFVLNSVAPAWANSCTATANCPGGGSVSCEGTDICSPGLDSVTCDGETEYCPNAEPCSVSYVCPSPPYSQSWYITCHDLSAPTSCSVGYDSVTCGGNTLTCADCESGPGFPCPAAW